MDTNIDIKNYLGQDTEAEIGAALMKARGLAQASQKVVWVYAKDGKLWMSAAYPLKNRVAKCLPNGRIVLKREMPKAQVEEAPKEAPAGEAIETPVEETA